MMVGGKSGTIPQVNPIFNNYCAFGFYLLLSIYLYVCNLSFVCTLLGKVKCLDIFTFFAFHGKSSKQSHNFKQY